jgi:hypothetical protein
MALVRDPKRVPTHVAKLFGVLAPYLLEVNKRSPRGQQAGALKSGARDNPEYVHALEMLGRIGRNGY